MLDSVAAPALQQLSEEMSSLIAKLAVSQATLRAMVGAYQHLNPEEWRKQMNDGNGEQDVRPYLLIPEDQAEALSALLDLLANVR